MLEDNLYFRKHATLENGLDGSVVLRGHTIAGGI
jgi:hypothetical protein